MTDDRLRVSGACPHDCPDTCGIVTDAVRPGVVASPKGRWAKHNPWQAADGRRNLNWTTPDALGDMAGQSTYHTNWVWLKPASKE